MKSNDHLSDETFTRYVTGFATEADRAAVEAWVAGRPDRARSLQGVLDAIEEWRPHPETVDSRKGWNEMQHKAASAAFPPEPQLMRERQAIRWAAAAVVAVLVGGGLIVGGQHLRSPRDAAAAKTYTTAPAQRASVRLADGTTLTLAPATTVRVSSEAVTVDGEAYFDVVPKARRAFAVQTANATVHVLGTRFVVRQYPTESVSRVVVEDGKVSVRARMPRKGGSKYGPQVLSVRMLAQVSDSGVLVQSGIDPEVYMGLTSGTLVFTAAPLHKVVAELSRAYGADIRVADSTLARLPVTMTAEFAKQPLSQVLEILVRITYTHVTRVGDALVVTPGRITLPAPPMEHDGRFPQPEKSYGR